MTFPTPQVPVDLSSWLDAVGETFATIEFHDSGCTSYGVRIDGENWFVKAAFDEQRDQLHGAIRVHATLQHPAIVPMESNFVLLGDGTAVVYPWIRGESLNDPFAPGALHRDDPHSALNRLRALPYADAVAAFDVVLDAHVAAEDEDLVAVDFYDGCLMYDFERRAIRLVDLDLYSPPYFLDRDQQFGSTRFMAPEEFVRGAAIDFRTTVYTLGRTGFQLLGEPGGEEDTFRGSDAQSAVLQQAAAIRPADRFPTVAALVSAWREASA